MAATAAPATPAVEADYLRQYGVAADATRGDALVAAYFLAFAQSQGVVDDATAQRIGAALGEVERGMDTALRELTACLGFDPYADNAPRAWLLRVTETLAVGPTAAADCDQVTHEGEGEP